MLRKSYELMQRTRFLVDRAGEQMAQIAATSWPAIAGDLAPAAWINTPADPWLGDASRGHDLIKFARTTPAARLHVLVSPAGLRDLDPDFHRFMWLYDLRAVGSNDARFAALTLVNGWIDVDPCVDRVIGQAQMTTQRLLCLIGTFSFYAPVMTEGHQQRLLRACLDQARHLKRQAKNPETPLDGLYCMIGLTAVALATHAGAHALPTDQLARAIARVVLADGGPYTRRPDDLPDLLRALVDLRHLFTHASLPLPPCLTHAIDRVVPALRFFQLGDGALACFHGGSTSRPQPLADILRHTGLFTGLPTTLPQTGFERLTAGNTHLIIDAGPSAPGNHASTTAFEMSVGGARLIVNCGQHATDPMWQDLLAATSAHSTLTLDHQDNTALGSPTDVDISRGIEGNGTVVQITHSGYMTRNGFEHTRSLHLREDGQLITGADFLATSVPPLAPVSAMVRFHLPPHVLASQLDGHTVRLTPTFGPVWILHAPADPLTIDDSVYLAATGRPEKTQQVVLTASITTATRTLPWVLQAA
jgi:uncharacterized heparinase superfamily protein